MNPKSDFMSRIDDKIAACQFFENMILMAALVALTGVLLAMAGEG